MFVYFSSQVTDDWPPLCEHRRILKVKLFLAKADWFRQLAAFSLAVVRLGSQPQVGGAELWRNLWNRRGSSVKLHKVNSGETGNTFNK